MTAFRTRLLTVWILSNSILALIVTRQSALALATHRRSLACYRSWRTSEEHVFPVYPLDHIRAQVLSFIRL